MIAPFRFLNDTRPITKSLLVLAGLLACSMLYAATTITVDAGKPGKKISPTLFGVFFEDINLSTDGGLYSELVRNRSFEDSETLQYWSLTPDDGKSMAKVCMADVNTSTPVPPLNAFNRKSALIQANGAFQFINQGYFGMHVQKGETYIFSMAVRIQSEFKNPLRIALIDVVGREIAHAEVSIKVGDWTYYTAKLHPISTLTDARLNISSSGQGTIYLDMVSLMPEKTWKNRGMRTDLAQAIDALKPTFFRFPGGCWVEGDDIEHMYQWKNTIGDIDSRKPLWSVWEYNATNGLGYHEYLQLSEDLGAEPLFCINAGISHKEVVKEDRLGPWIQDALDAIEYANGPVSSVWGGIRAKNGHPQPFNLKYVEVGNENFGAQYYRNYELITKAIKAKYPEMIVIANDWVGGYPNNPKTEMIDEHYYNNPDWFLLNANKYDTYDRSGPKIFVGEYAANSAVGNGNLRGAIGEAAFMVGMERNSDVVLMAAYAPLLCHTKHKRWPINLINYDSHRWYGLPSYYVQKMFAENQGTSLLHVDVQGAPEMDFPQLKGRIGLGTWNNAAEFKDLKVTSPEGKILYQSDFSKGMEGWTKTGPGEWSVEKGVLRQSAIAQNVTAYVGDYSWTDYTITLKARKLSGENGFQIYFRNQPNSGRIRWDLGGYNNSTNEMKIGMHAGSIKGSIENGRWYDVRLEIKGNTVKGYLDGVLLQEVSVDNLNTKKLIVTAATHERTKDVIVKVVQADSKPLKTSLLLKGLSSMLKTATVTVLTGQSALDENSIEQPLKVSPKVEQIQISGSTIKRVFPANSFTIIRIPAK